MDLRGQRLKIMCDFHELQDSLVPQEEVSTNGNPGLWKWAVCQATKKGDQS